MSDKKTPSNPPSAPDTSGQEFERFLRGEDTATAATYRKLASAEPDAQLDARVRALARRALHASPATAADAAARGDAAREATGRTRGARWMPAFASAAVLVLAAGVVWQLGPRNWARNDATTDVALDATTARSASPAAADTKPDRTATNAHATPPVDASGAATAAQSTGALQPSAADEGKAPLAFPEQAAPPEPPKPRIPTPPVSGASPAASPQPQSRKEEVARDAVALAERSRAPESPEPSREKRANDASRELKKAPAEQVPATTALASAPPNLAARAVPDDRVANRAAVRSPAPVVAERVAPAPRAPSSPEVGAEATPTRDPAIAQGATPAHVTSTTSPSARSDAARSSVFPAAPAAAAPRGDARRQDEATTRQAPQRATATAAPTATGGTNARPAPAPAAPPPPPPPPSPTTSSVQAPTSPSAFAPEPAVASDAAAAQPKARSRAAASDAEAQKQAYADHFALSPGLPPANIPGRPTAAQLAAWPAPNCHAAGTVTSSGAGVDARAWNYPPDVPDSAHLRVAIVKQYLDLESPEGALKAYADFHHCYPEDRWPPSLLRRLGTQ